VVPTFSGSTAVEPRLQRKEAAYFEPDVVDKIAASMPEPYGPLVRLLGVLGPRFGEAAALQRRSVDLLRRRLLIDESLTDVNGRLVRSATKTHAARSVPLPRFLADELALHLAHRVGPQPDAPLFTGPDGGPLHHSNFRTRVWRPTLESLGLPAVGMHVLRHSAAARMIHAGATPKVVQTVLGHSSAAFTLTVYGHVFDADLDGLAERLDMLATKLRRPQDGPTLNLGQTARSAKGD
jgi:integrase